MKGTTWLLGIALACVVALTGAGCKKEQVRRTVGTYDGVQIDVAAFWDKVANTGPDTDNAMANIRFGLRYKDYVKALMALDKMKDDPKLNDAQKKAVSDLIEQVKQAAKNKEAAQAAQPPSQ